MSRSPLLQKIQILCCQLNFPLTEAKTFVTREKIEPIAGYVRSYFRILRTTQCFLSTLHHAM